uniref:Uncharacterized protein n=1 Tax=viral metagenome TaxID=1070528 RepID=A0A2V0RMH8_9ZZZZ
MKKYVKEAIGYSDAWHLNAERLLIAGPTSGKSTLITKFAKFGIRDTDDILFDKQIFPDWHAVNRKGINPSVALLIRFINHGSNSLWLTNMWAKDFLETLLSSDGTNKKVIFVFRDSAEEIQQLMKQRGGTDRFSLSQLKGWVEDWREYSSAVSNNVIKLREGQFLSDVVCPTKDGWRVM